MALIPLTPAPCLSLTASPTIAPSTTLTRPQINYLSNIRRSNDSFTVQKWHDPSIASDTFPGFGASNTFDYRTSAKGAKDKFALTHNIPPNDSVELAEFSLRTRTLDAAMLDEIISSESRSQEASTAAPEVVSSTLREGTSQIMSQEYLLPNQSTILRSISNISRNIRRNNFSMSLYDLKFFGKKNLLSECSNSSLYESISYEPRKINTPSRTSSTDKLNRIEEPTECSIETSFKDNDNYQSSNWIMKQQNIYYTNNVLSDAPHQSINICCSINM